MSSLLCNDCKQPVCGRKHAATCYGCENWQLPYCDKCLFPVDSKGQQGSVQEERAPSLNMETLNNGNRYSKYHPKSKSFPDDSDDMVNKKCLPPRETEDTDLYQDFQSLKFYPKVDPRPASLDGFADNGPPRPASLDGFADNGPPRPASLDGFADNGPLETPIAEAVGFGNLGIDVKPDVSYQSVFLPMDKETPSFIPKTDWGKTPKLSKKPKDEFQRQSVTYETDKAQQEMLECPIQLTTGTLKKEQSVHPAVETDCHQEMQPVPKLMMEHDPKQRYSAQEAHCYIEEHQKKEMVMKNIIPKTVTTILQPGTGPVRNSTIQKLRDKIKPYTKHPPSPALAVTMPPVEEINIYISRGSNLPSEEDITSSPSPINSR